MEEKNVAVTEENTQVNTQEKKKRGRPKKTPSVRCSVWCIELYPDNPDHAKALEVLKDGMYEFCGALHDKDTWTEEDQEANPEHVAGELKKAHWHIVLKYANAVRIDTVTTEFGVEVRFVQPCRSPKRAIRYLIHADDPDKYQYALEDIIGTMEDAVNSALSSEPSEGDRVAELLDYIDSLDRPISTSEFARHCARHGYWDVFRRAGAIFCRCLNEHNADCERAEYHKRRDGEFAAQVDRARFDGFVEGHHAQIVND